MFEVKYEEGLWWIFKDDERLDDIGGFIDPISPEIILKEILNDKDVSDEYTHPTRVER